MNNNVPQWMLDSTTAPTEQNKEVDMIVAGFIGAFRKRGFDQQHIGILMTSAFLLSLEVFTQPLLDVYLHPFSNERLYL